MRAAISRNSRKFVASLNCNRNNLSNFRFSPILQNANFSSGKHPVNSSGHVTVHYNDDGSSVVAKNVGFQRFLDRVYATTFGGIASSLCVATVLPHISNFASEPTLYLVSGAIMSIGGAIGVAKFRTHLVKETAHAKQDEVDEKREVQVEYLATTNTLGRQISFAAMTAGMGMSLAPALLMFDANGIVLPALLMTTTVFGGATLYVRSAPPGRIASWQPALVGGLTGLVGCAVSGVAAELFFGANTFSNIMLTLNTYAGVPLFAGLVAFDTHKATEMYHNNQPDHMLCASQLYLDFMNLFVRFMEIMARIRQNNNK